MENGNGTKPRGEWKCLWKKRINHETEKKGGKKGWGRTGSIGTQQRGREIKKKEKMKRRKKNEKVGSAEIWTRIAGFRVLSANHYTTEPPEFLIILLVYDDNSRHFGGLVCVEKGVLKEKRGWIWKKRGSIRLFVKKNKIREKISVHFVFENNVYTTLLKWKNWWWILYVHILITPYP